MRLVTYSVGVGYDKANKPIQNATKKIALAAKYLAQVFGGVSVIDRVNGGWIDDKGTLIVEDARLFRVVTDASDKVLRRVARTLRRRFNQSSVLYDAIQAQAEFI